MVSGAKAAPESIRSGESEPKPQRQAIRRDGLRDRPVQKRPDVPHDRPFHIQ